MNAKGITRLISTSEHPGTLGPADGPAGPLKSPVTREPRMESARSTNDNFDTGPAKRAFALPHAHQCTRGGQERTGEGGTTQGEVPRGGMAQVPQIPEYGQIRLNMSELC